jgi:8-oxo-dGTP pyrophosphatase MutT (NUDIX family)
MANPKENWKREYAAGGIVYREGDEVPEVLLIEPNKRNSSEGQGVWRIPKGLIEENEPAEKAAVREVREEAGVKGGVEELLDEIKIFYKFEGENIFKTVKVYLMHYVSGEARPDGFEVHAAGWFPIHEAMNMLHFKSERGVLGKARKILLKREAAETEFPDQEEMV